MRRDINEWVLEIDCPTCGVGVGIPCARKRSRIGSPKYHKIRLRVREDPGYWWKRRP